MVTSLRVKMASMPLVAGVSSTTVGSWKTPSGVRVTMEPE